LSDAQANHDIEQVFAPAGSALLSALASVMYETTAWPSRRRANAHVAIGIQDSPSFSTQAKMRFANAPLRVDHHQVLEPQPR
jgi:hypothetical protein